MLKVIKKGVLPTPVVFRGECGHCGCVVEQTGYEANASVSKEVWCPTEGCGSVINLYKYSEHYSTLDKYKLSGISADDFMTVKKND